MSDRTVDPLKWDLPIVDPSGRPTLEFMRKFNAQRTDNAESAVEIENAQDTADAAQETATEALTVANSKPDSFLELNDTPDTYAGQTGKVALVNADEDGLEFGDVSTVGTFLDLTDTPDAYTGQASKAVQVKADETGLEFVAVGAGTGVQLDRDRYGPPEAADFATLVGTNSVDPSLTDTTTRGLVFDFSTSLAVGTNVRLALKAVPAVTDYTVISRVTPTVPVSVNVEAQAIAFYDGTKILGFGLTNNSSGSSLTIVRVSKWTNNTTFSSAVATVSILGNAPEWFKVDVVSGAPKTFYYSHDGATWIEIVNASQSAFITPTHVGFGLHSSGQASVSGTSVETMNVLYYSDPDITPTVRYPGTKGETGAAGAGVPVGGTAHQALTKIDATDQNTQWETIDKTFVGLGNVDNTSDADKPVSTAQATAIAVVQSDIDAHEADTANPHSVTKTQVGLGNVDNTSDATKQTANDLRYLQLTGGTITGDITYTRPASSGNATISITSNQGVAVSGERWSVNAFGPAFAMRKSRGATLETSTYPNSGDACGTFQFQINDATSGIKNVANIVGTVIAATPSATDSAGRLTFNTTPVGSTTLAENMRLDQATGLSMYGANTVIGASRHFWLREYASASLPSATQSSMLASSSDIPGGAITSDGTGWHSPGVKRLRTVTANTSFSVPAGWAIDTIYFHNTTANAVTGNVLFGTTAGGSEVTGVPVGASAIGSVGLLYKVFSRTVATTIFVQASTSWNSANVEFSVVMRKVF